IHDETPPGGMEEGYFSTAFDHGGPTVARLTGSGEHEWVEARTAQSHSILASLRDPRHYPVITSLAEKYELIRIFREWSFGRNAVFRSPQPADMRSDSLEEDFSNLGLFLNK